MHCGSLALQDAPVIVHDVHYCTFGLLGQPPVINQSKPPLFKIQLLCSAYGFAAQQLDFENQLSTGFQQPNVAQLEGPEVLGQGALNQCTSGRPLVRKLSPPCFLFLSAFLKKNSVASGLALGLKSSRNLLSFHLFPRKQA